MKRLSLIAIAVLALPASADDSAVNYNLRPEPSELRPLVAPVGEFLATQDLAPTPKETTLPAPEAGPVQKAEPPTAAPTTITYKEVRRVRLFRPRTWKRRPMRRVLRPVGRLIRRGGC